MTHIFWSEIGSGFEEPGGTPPPRIPRSTPPGATPPRLMGPRGQRDCLFLTVECRLCEDCKKKINFQPCIF